MGRPLNPRFLGTIANGAPAVHQIQALVFGAADGSATAGHLTAQNSPHRFRATTVNGTSLTTLAPAAGLAKGQAAVKVFPIASYPTTYATANATLGVTGNAAVVKGGAGYVVGDYVNLVGGTFSVAANVKVLAVTGGAVTSLSTPINIVGNQMYSALPANISSIATANATGVGTGLTVAANFGLDEAWILTGGAGYTPSSSATVTFESPVGLAEATVTNPTTTVGGAVTTGQLTVTNSGILNAMPQVTVQNDSQSTIEYVKTIGNHYVNTYSGNQYKWLARGGNVPSDYAGLGVKLAFLDTL